MNKAVMHPVEPFLVPGGQVWVFSQGILLGRLVSTTAQIEAAAREIAAPIVTLFGGSTVLPDEYMVSLYVPQTVCDRLRRSAGWHKQAWTLAGDLITEPVRQTILLSSRGNPQDCAVITLEEAPRFAGAFLRECISSPQPA